MDRMTRIGFTAMMSIVIVPVMGMICFGRNGPRTATTSTFVLFAVLSLIGIGCLYVFLSFLSDMSEKSSPPPLTQQQRLWNSIQAGYRVMYLKGADELPSGYQKMEQLYIRKYGSLTPPRRGLEQ